MSIVPLLSFVDGEYRLHEPSLRWLAERTEPFAVAACAGRYRTGKSFLLNRLTEQPAKQGFGVGGTVQACTRGIWMLQRFLPGRDGGPDVLVLDSEGFGATDADEENDVRILALAVLFSSALMYNSTSHLDESAIQTLSLMTRVADAVSHAERTLYWILRDFALQMVDAEGEPLTHAQYLEQALDESRAPASKCATRTSIKSVFARRHLVTLPRPHRGVAGLDANSVNGKFVKFLDQFRGHLLAHAQPVAADGVPMTGAVYAEYVSVLVEQVNRDGAVPRLADSWTLLARVQLEDATRRALLAHAEEACPAADEEVRAGGRGAAHVASAVDVAGARHVGRRRRLAVEVLRHRRALGRVQDAAALAN